MEDLLEQANEIQESLGRSYAVPDELDEADLEAGKSKILSALSSSAELVQNSTLSPSKKKKRAHRTWRISTKLQTSSTSPQLKLQRYVPGVPDHSHPDIDTLFLSQRNQRRSRPLERRFGLRLHSSCLSYGFLTRCVIVACSLFLQYQGPLSTPPVRDRCGIGHAIVSPPSSRSPRCYPDQAFTRRPPSPERVY